MTSVNKRVLKDITEGRVCLKKEFGIYLEPEESNFYRVHFVLPGPSGTPFEGGLYHGMIRLNENHPHAPPNIHMITPNGRFVAESCPIPNGSRGICTTTSSFHPETWTPMNNLETIIKGFVSLMCDPYEGGVGGISSTQEQMKKLAKDSIKNLINDKLVKELFPDLYQNLVNGTYQNKNQTKSKIIEEGDFDEPKTKLNKKKASDGDFSSGEEMVLKTKRKTKKVEKRKVKN